MSYYTKYPGDYEPGYLSQFTLREKVYMLTGLSILFASILTSLLISTGGVSMGMLVLAIIAWIIGVIWSFFATTESSRMIILFMMVSASAVLITPMIQYALLVDPIIVAESAGITGIIVLGMFSYATIKKPNLHRLGRFLSVAVWVIIAVLLLGFFIQYSAFTDLLLSIVIAIIFSLYILYDLSRIERREIFSPAYAALMLYIDIFIVFKQILYLLIRSRE